jgi:hypothetical protein
VEFVATRRSETGSAWRALSSFDSGTPLAEGLRDAGPDWHAVLGVIGLYGEDPPPGQRWLGLAAVREHFLGARAVATPTVIEAIRK